MSLIKASLTLILLSLFGNPLFADYLHKDELIYNPSFKAEIEKLGSELYEKTGISLRLLMLKRLPENQTISEYEKEAAKEFDEPTVLLTFSEIDSKVDIFANDKSLYELFDKKQVLSPVASPLQAFFVALFYSRDLKSFKETLGEHGGTIIPLLAQKAKDNELLGKYSGAMFNGYADIAEQIAKSRGIELKNAVGSSNQTSIFIIKVIFYGFVLYALILYIKRKLYLKRQKK